MPLIPINKSTKCYCYILLVIWLIFITTRFVAQLLTSFLCFHVTSYHYFVRTSWIVLFVISILLDWKSSNTFYEHILLFSSADYHFTSPVWLNGASVIRAEMEVDLISMANFNWLKLTYFQIFRVISSRDFRRMKATFSKDHGVITRQSN